MQPTDSAPKLPKLPNPAANERAVSAEATQRELPAPRRAESIRPPRPAGDSVGPATAAPDAMKFPAEPVEDSADDPIPEFPLGKETPEELDAALLAEPFPVEDLSPEDAAYRRLRLSQRDFYPRVRRRFARHVPWQFLEDVCQETFVRAQTAPDFPSPVETIYPWIYKPGSAARKKQMRAWDRDKKRKVGTEYIDRECHVPAPDLDPMPDTLAKQADFVAEALADDTGRQRTLKMYEREVGHEHSPSNIAGDNDITVDALHHRTMRLRQWLRDKYATSIGAGVLLLFGASIVYYVTHHITPEKMVHTIPAPVMQSPQPVPVPMPTEVPVPENLPGPTNLPVPTSRAPIQRPAPVYDSVLPPAVDPNSAVGLRDAGLKLCWAHKWGECLDKLNASKRADPTLANDPTFKKMYDRAQAEQKKLNGRLPGAP